MTGVGGRGHAVIVLKPSGQRPWPWPSTLTHWLADAVTQATHQTTEGHVWIGQHSGSSSSGGDWMTRGTSGADWRWRGARHWTWQLHSTETRYLPLTTEYTLETRYCPQWDATIAGPQRLRDNACPKVSTKKCPKWRNRTSDRESGGRFWIGKPGFLFEFPTNHMSVSLSFRDICVWDTDWRTDNADHYYSCPPHCGAMWQEIGCMCDSVCSWSCPGSQNAMTPSGCVLRKNGVTVSSGGQIANLPVNKATAL